MEAVTAQLLQTGITVFRKALMGGEKGALQDTEPPQKVTKCAAGNPHLKQTNMEETIFFCLFFQGRKFKLQLFMNFFNYRVATDTKYL